MPTIKHLTEDQKVAVTAQDRVLMVLAPAGSGKTEVIINRIIRILNDSSGQFFRILAVTYTYKSAAELRERVNEVAGDQSWRVEAKTIHSFVLEWLRSHGSPVGVEHNVIVYAENIHRFEILQRYLDTLGEPTLDYQDMDKIFDKFDSYRTKLEPSDVLSDFPGLPTNTNLREMYDAYLTSLREAGGIDFPGVLYQFHELLKSDSSLVSHIQRVYKHVLVDECQDLTKVQSKILKIIVGDKLNLFVVGDQRQSVNSWAGGEITNAYDLVGNEAKKQNLVHNFRCANKILGLANRVAEHFSDSKNSAITPDNAPPGYIDFKQADNEEEESQIVTNWIKKLLDKGLDKNIVIPGESTKVEWEDIGIIGRTKYTLDKIHSNLIEMGIPLSILTETSGLLLTSEARLLIDLIHIRNDTNNLPATRRASQELQNLDNLESDSINTPEDVWQKATEMLPEIVSIAKTKEFEDFPNSIKNISINNEDWNEDSKRISEWWASYRSTTRGPNRSFQGLMSYIFHAQRTRPSDRGVRLLTAHRAKGLEFKAVAVVGLNKGTFPDYRNLELSKLDEERRIFYVAITRASRSLLLTRPKTRILYRSGKVRDEEPSQFLEESGIL